ncbi:MAG TPA: hypothetical protein VL624_13535, partial [Caldimonas sp.]|nr:hypothetical protein [Caldimonas sp.]
MNESRFTAAQQGVPLAEAMPSRTAAAAAQAKRRAVHARGVVRRSRAPAGATLPAPAALSTAERLRLLDAFETVIGGVYTHLPLKRAR